MASRARCRLGAAALLGAIALAGCGSGSSPTSSSTASTPAVTSSTATASTTTTTSTVTVTPSPSSATTAAGGAGTSGQSTSTPACASGTTAVSLGSGGAGLGHSGIVLLLRNAGARTCVLRGYPGAALVARSGSVVNAVRTPSGYLGGLAPGSNVPPAVNIGPGQTASALLEGVDSSSGGGPCPTYPALLATPPNETSTVRLDRSLSLCNPQIHPVVAGTTGRGP